MNMITNIARDVAKNIQETQSLELIITTGSALKDMFITDNTIQDRGLYLVKFHDDGRINSYSLLS